MSVIFIEPTCGKQEHNNKNSFTCANSKGRSECASVQSGLAELRIKDVFDGKRMEKNTCSPKLMHQEIFH